jgi:hypothetical protein
MGKNKKFTKEHTRTFYNIKMALIRYINILNYYQVMHKIIALK